MLYVAEVRSWGDLAILIVEADSIKEAGDKAYSVVPGDVEVLPLVLGENGVALIHEESWDVE